MDAATALGVNAERACGGCEQTDAQQEQISADVGTGAVGAKSIDQPACALIHCLLAEAHGELLVAARSRRRSSDT